MNTYQCTFTGNGSFTFSYEDTITGETGSLTAEVSRKGRPEAFITTWRTVGASEVVTIPTTAAGYTFQVDWGDGLIEAKSGTPGNFTHTYATPGDHLVQIWGTFPRLYCNANVACQKLVSVDHWGDIAWTNFNGAFYGATNLTIKATDTPNLNTVTDMANAFRGIANLTGNFANWDVSKITTMASLFQGATYFDQDLSSWTPIATTNMTNMLLDTSLSNYNYNALLGARSQQNLKTGVTFNASPTRY